MAYITRRISVEEYMQDDLNAKREAGQCSVYWDHFAVDRIVRSENDPDTYYVCFGGLYGCSVGGYVQLSVHVPADIDSAVSSPPSAG